MSAVAEDFEAWQRVFRHRPVAAGRPLRLGLIQLASDFTLENEWRQLLVDGLELYSTRTPCSPTVAPEQLRGLADGLASSAELLVPGLELDVLVFGCTSGSMLIGEGEVARLLRSARPGIAVSNPWTAVKAALRHLGARRIAVLTPYIAAVNRPLCAGLEEAGFAVACCGTFAVLEDAAIPRIGADDIVAAARVLLAMEQVDALFLACTNLRTLDVLEELEAELQIPVVSSNQAMFWHALRSVGFARPVPGFGRLLADQSPVGGVES